MRLVRDGRAAGERDSVLLEQVDHPYPVLAGLLRAALENDGTLSVLDFGGALGTTYFQCRRLLDTVTKVRWSIVEQPAHVACGQAEFANEELCFYESVDSCIRTEQPAVLLLSSVIQYLPEPYTLISDLLRHRLPHVIVDRTPFMRSGRDRLTVQRVPPWIYEASYPAWFLSEQRFLACFEKDYRLLTSFSALDTHHPEGDEADYKGFIFQRCTEGG